MRGSSGSFYYGATADSRTGSIPQHCAIFLMMWEVELQLRQFVLLAIINKTLWAGVLHSKFLLACEGKKILKH